jgi:site-specific DNA recombinase
MGGQSPYGYVWKDGKFVVEPKEAPVRKLMFELFAEHKRKKTVARMLNDRGFRTRKGAKWSAVTVHRLLRDPSASGTRVANYSKSLGKGKAAGRKPKEDWVYHPVEPIISETLWNECQAILAAQERRPKPIARRPVHPFAGVTYCRCGDKMYVPSNSPKYICRSCRNKVPIIDLDGVFHEQLRNFYVSSEDVADHLAAGNEVIKSKEELLAVLRAEERKVSSDIERLFELYQDGQLSKADFGPRHKPLSDRLKEIERELPALEAELDVMRINQLSEAELMAGGQDLFERWPNLPADDRRDLVSSIVEKIIIGEGDIDISLLYTPPSLDGGNKGTHQHGFMAATSWTRDG